jgi:3-keto-disaccharide hydrolase
MRGLRPGHSTRVARRRSLRSLTILGAGLVVAAAVWAQRPNNVTFEEGEEGWYPLFDGKSLDGWSAPPNSDWKVVDGTIVSESGGSNLLMSDDTFSDFELKADFIAAPSGNSGIFLRVTGKIELAGMKGYEVNVAPPGNPFPTGSIVHLESNGPGVAPKFGAGKKATGIGDSADWRTYDIVAQGARFTIKIDGQTVAELEDPDPILEGYLGLQHNVGKVQFRNVKIRRLK